MSVCNQFGYYGTSPEQKIFLGGGEPTLVVKRKWLDHSFLFFCSGSGDSLEESATSRKSTLSESRPPIMVKVTPLVVRIARDAKSIWHRWGSHHRPNRSERSPNRKRFASLDIKEYTPMFRIAGRLRRIFAGAFVAFFV